MREINALEKYAFVLRSAPLKFENCKLSRQLVAFNAYFNAIYLIDLRRLFISYCRRNLFEETQNSEELHAKHKQHAAHGCHAARKETRRNAHVQPQPSTVGSPL